jgi:superfamily II DNA or RNA helicase
MLTLSSPTVMRLTGYEPHASRIRDELTFTDKKVDWAYRKFISGGGAWFLRRYGQAAYDERLAELQAARRRCILFQDDRGLWTYSGLRPKFEHDFGDVAQRAYQIPSAKLMPWAKVPSKEPRYYQLAAEDALVIASAFGPAAVEMGTGLGKTYIIERILKRLGLQAVVMSPSTNIAGQIYDELAEHFGKSKVGMFGDGKKQLGKLITVGIGASLRNVKVGTPAWKHLSAAPVFIADESHMCPAETLQQVCFGLCADAPYRFFFSGTQMRQDGLDLVLDGITGPIVYRMSVQEGIDQGFLAKVIFRMCWMDSNVSDRDGNLVWKSDVNDMTRAHAFYNPDVNRRAAEFANKAVSIQERPTVIMIDEIEQLKYILPHLRYEARFAHGPLTTENKQYVPEQFWDDEPKKLVEQFNRGEFPILIGTSCIRTGTDIQRVKTLINLCQGKSEVEVRQTVGRCTRLAPGKEDCIFIDFGIKNVEILEKHAKVRKSLYQEIYPSFAEMTL